MFQRNSMYKGKNMLDQKIKAIYHLPGLFEFYDLYKAFLPLYKNKRDWFYDWCQIGSIYGAPMDCCWGGGRIEESEVNSDKAFELVQEYGISARLTFSNSLLKEADLQDKKCNELCRALEMLEQGPDCLQHGVIVHSDLLTNYIREKYPKLYLVSSTTKVLTDYPELEEELKKEEFRYVVADFRLNKAFKELEKLEQSYKDKVEFLCNEACWFECKDRRECYKSVSKKSLGIMDDDHVCTAPDSSRGYMFSRAMTNPGFIGIKDIRDIYLPMGFTNFKIEGRSLGSALILEFLLYYMTKPEYQLNVREEIYLDNYLDLF